MSELWVLAFAALAGAGLGLLFFGGLWYTIQQLPHSRRPALLLLGSFVLRLSLTLFGFYLILGGTAAAVDRLLAALLGFLLVRLLLTRRLRRAGNSP